MRYSTKVLRVTKPVLLLASLLLVVACASTKATPVATRPPPGGQVTPASPGVSRSASLQPVLQHVPASATAVFYLQPSLFSFMETWLQSHGALRADLRAYFTRVLGMDLSQVRGIVGYGTSLTDPPSLAIHVMLAEPGYIKKGKVVGAHRGVDIHLLDEKLVAVALPAGLVLGTIEGVKVAIDLAQGKMKTLSPSSPILAGPLDPQTADLFLGVDLAAIKEPSIQAALGPFKLRTGALILDKGRVSLSLIGDPDKLQALKGMVMMGLGLARKQAEALRAKAMQAQEDNMESLGSILAYHLTQPFLAEMEPRINGNVMTSSLTWPLTDTRWSFVTYAGILAAVAVPAFIKYIRKSKAAEATQGLAKIRVGVQSYHEQTYRKGRPFRFPASTSWTPAAPCCKGEETRCVPEASTFSHPTWKALAFTLTDPHFYQYRFTSKGKGLKASFVIEAQGDLDCDGNRSSFRLAGSLSPDGSLKLGEPVVVDETE